MGLFVFLLGTSIAWGHDTWVQTNTNLIRPADAVHIDLMLGNHGNDHRDFKLASKIDLEGCTLDVVLPDGKKLDIRDRLVDLGYAPKEGFWSARFVGAKPGMYVVSHTLDKVVKHGKAVRSIKSAKTCFVLSESLDKIIENRKGYDRPLGHPLELVNVTDPVIPMGPGVAVQVKLLHRGKPLANTKVSFIPRGTTLAEGFDKRYEKMTDASGKALFVPKEGNFYLIVAHKKSDDEKGPNYTATHYSATLTVYVPQYCPCCDD